MAQTQEQIRQKINQGIATDADMDEYVSSGYDVNALGPKGQEFYNQRKAAMEQGKPEKSIKFSLPPMNTAFGATPNTGFADPDKARKELRAQNPNDNEAYKEALETQGLEEKASSGPYKLRTIQDAYYSGDIDKNTRDYMLVDALSKFARNTGRDIGNIAAAYSGGTVNNEREGSLWDARNAEMMKQGISSEAATVEGGDKQMERAQQKASLTGAQLANELADKKLNLPREYSGLIKNADNIENPLLRAAVKGGARQLLDKSVNGGEIKPADLITSIVVAGGNDLSTAAQRAGKSTEQFVMDSLKDFMAPANNTLGGIASGILGGSEAGKASVSPSLGAYNKAEHGNNYKVYGAGQKINEAIGFDSNKDTDKKSGNDFKKWVGKNGTRTLIGRETSFENMTDEELDRALQKYIELLERERTH